MAHQKLSVVQFCKSIMTGTLLAAVCISCNALSSETKTKGPPQVKTISDNVRLIRSYYEKGEIDRLCRDAIHLFRQNVESFTNAFDFEYALTELGDQLNPMVFMAYVSTNADVRDEASRCEEEFVKFDVELFTNPELYQVVKESVPTNASEERLVSELLLKFEKNGMNLSSEELERYKLLKGELASMEAQFSKNLNEDTSAVAFSREELDGVSED